MSQMLPGCNESPFRFEGRRALVPKHLTEKRAVTVVTDKGIETLCSSCGQCRWRRCQMVSPPALLGVRAA